MAGVLYGIGLGLTFDEFGMWLHLGGSYWQRASWDAVVVVASGLVLAALAPALKQFRTLHWWGTVVALLAVAGDCLPPLRIAELRRENHHAQAARN